MIMRLLINFQLKIRRGRRDKREESSKKRKNGKEKELINYNKNRNNQPIFI